MRLRNHPQSHFSLQKEFTAEDAAEQSRNQNPPRRHGDTEKHGEKHNFAAIAPEIGFMLALEKGWAQEHRKKQRSRRNMLMNEEIRPSSA